MIFTPTRITYGSIGWITDLRYPVDKWRIALLSQSNKECWYAAQEPQDLIDLSEDKTFQKFWHRVYITPLKIKRFLYSLKFWS